MRKSASRARKIISGSPSAKSGDVETRLAMIDPTAIPNVSAESPRSEKPLSITSTRTTRAPMQNPTAEAVTR
jgi:hypothetical protein